MSLFGTPASSTPQTSSLFGNPTASTTGGSSLFGQSAATPAAPTSSLFGSAPVASAPSSGGLSGSTPSTSAPSGGGLFGPTPATAAPATGGGLFGNTQHAATAAGGGGLFGSTTTTAAPAPGGLFGTATTSAPATGGGLFGSASTAPVASGGGLFGGGQQQPQQQAPTFNQSTTAGNSGLFAQTQSNTVPAATVDVTRLTPTTRFGDCHPSVQQELEGIEREIQDQITLSRSLADRFPAHRTALDSIPADASVLSHRLATTKLFQTSDQAAYDQIRAAHDADDQASTLSIRNLDLFRLPHAQRQQFIQRSSMYGSATQPQRENDVTSNKPMITYFNAQVDEMDRKLGVIRRSVREVEESLKSVEMQAAESAQSAGVAGRDLTAVTGGVWGRQDARRLNRTLREFNEALKDVSGRIVDAREGLETLTAAGR